MTVRENMHENSRYGGADIHSNVFDYSGGKIRRKTVDMTQEVLDLNADIIIKGVNYFEK